MFGIFKKQKEVKITPLFRVVDEPKVTVEEIHNAFYTEVDRLLESCNVKHSLETEHAEVIEKNKRLRKLGFNNTVVSDKAIEEENRIKRLQRANREKLVTIAAIKYFSNTYPQYKFITKESVNILCEKYGLVFGDVDNFIGDVPNKNIDDIENFTIKDEDKTFITEFIGMYSSRTREEISYNSNIKKKGDYYSSTSSDTRYSEKPFAIVAPIKDFNTEGLKLTGNELKRKPVVKDDPIVLKSVRFQDKSYFLIVTAWGDEASDPLVLNQNHN